MEIDAITVALAQADWLDAPTSDLVWEVVGRKDRAHIVAPALAHFESVCGDPEYLQAVRAWVEAVRRPTEGNLARASYALARANQKSAYGL